MDFPSTKDAVDRATPNVVELLDRHAKWSAQMCRKVPSVETQMCQNMPSTDDRALTQSAETCPNVPQSAGMCHVDETCKTNPIRVVQNRPLSYRQLAAARLIVKGRGSVEVAKHLGVNRHTVAVWKQNPAFRAELERLRAILTASAVAPRAPVRVAPPPPPRRPMPTHVRMTRAQIEQEDRACEAMIEEVLRTGRRPKGW